MINPGKASRVAPFAKGNKLVQLYITAEPDAGFYLAMAANLRIIAYNNSLTGHDNYV